MVGGQLWAKVKTPWQRTILISNLLITKAYAKITVYGRMIKFEHSIFALPFALSALLLAHQVNPVTPRLIFLIIMAVVWARSAGMGFNQLVDARWDAKNPRTAGREIPAGRISPGETGIFVLISSFLFVLSALAISYFCFFCSIPVLLILFSYSYAKRYTWLCHLILGFVQALGPLGVWLAVTGNFSAKISVLSLALGTYIAGFDLLYACQDMDFDRKEGLYSVPANLGIRRAMDFSIILHVVTFTSLLSLYWVFHLSYFYLGYVLIIGLLLIVEHRIVKPDDLSRINIAFFNINSSISVLMLAAIVTEELIRRNTFS